MESKRCYGCMQLKQNSPVCEHCGYDERRPNAPNQLPVGTVLQGKYLLGKVLGQGGFGITYLGRDMKLDIPVAIKEYYPMGMVSRESTVDCAVTVVADGEDTRFAENRDRFLREAQTLARLEDVGEVVQVKNFFEENNTAYIVMGYVKGITLKEHMRRSGGKLPAREVFRLLEPLMEALGQVHALGLVHRDISPDNIMLQPNRKARLIDFGAAHTATSAGDKSTQAVLKHGFAPPEQYQSKGNLGPWTDVYAVCATVYHCITGLMPPNITDRFMGEADFEWAALSGLTAGQLAALKQGLALQYKDRFQTMEELCAKLFDREEPVPQPAPMPEPIPRPQPQPVPEPKPVPQLEPKPAPKPQPRQEEPSVSETGTVALIREETEAPAVHTAPVVREQPIVTAPVEPQPAYTAPVRCPDSYTAPVKRREEPASETKKTAPGAKKFVFIAAAVAVLALVLLLFLPRNPKSTGSRILMNPGFVTKEYTEGDSTWEKFDEEANYAFGTNVLRTEVASITFLDTTKDAPKDAVDASQEQDGSVLAWAIPNGNLYDLFLAAEGQMIAPTDCSTLFYYYVNVSTIRFCGMLYTGDTTAMSAMFAECPKLKELDLSCFNTDNVEYMDMMFYNCSKLTELDLSNFNTQRTINMTAMFEDCDHLVKLDIHSFDTSNVTHMLYMFEGCSSIKELDVSGFNTGNVEYLNSMFEGCSSLQELDVSGFDTRNVADMGRMFYGCSNLKALDVSGFDTRNVCSLAYMFHRTDKLKGISGHFDVSGVTEYEYFMDFGDTYNGEFWEELFR